VTRALTRQDCIDQLPAGSDPLVVDLHVRATAGDRHASRIATADAMVRAAYPDATPRQLGAICALEAGGVGGPGGYSGDSTSRMSWAASLGKGRKQATDGQAWTAAITAAGHNLLPGGPSTADVAAAAEVLAGSDLEWPLAWALRRALGTRDDIEASTAAAELARAIAARCEPDSGAGRLAERYNLRTLPQAWRGTAWLRYELVAEMLGVPEAQLDVGVYTTEVTVPIYSADHAPVPVTILVVARDTWPVPNLPAHNAMFRVEISTRDLDAAHPLIRRAWPWREDDEHSVLADLHRQMTRLAGDPNDDEAIAHHDRVLAALRDGWEREDAAPDPSVAEELAGMSDADRRVAERVSDLPDIATPGCSTARTP
jgi:hypothetical protein